MKSRFRTLLEWLADWQIVPVGLLAPIFMLADRLPNGVIALAVLAIPALWAVHRVVRGRFFTPTPVDLTLLVWLATLPVGVWAAAVPALSLPPLLRYLFAVTLFYALVNSLSSERRIELAGWTTVIGTLLVTGLGVVGTAWGDPKFLPVDLAQYIPYLIGSFWHTAGFHPHVLAGVSILLSPILLSYALAARTWPRRLILWFLVLMETFTLVLTQSRGALLGFAVALLVVVVGRVRAPLKRASTQRRPYGRDRRWLWLVPVLAVAAAAGWAATWGRPYGAQPLLNLVSDKAWDSVVRSGEERLELFSHALYALEDFPLTGVGLGMSPRVLPLLYPLLLVRLEPELPHVHNIYLQVGVDHGLPGLIAFLAFLILLSGMGMQAIRLSRGRPWEPLAIGLLAGLVATLVYGLVDTVWGTPRSHPILWAEWGLLTAAWCQTRAWRSLGPPDGRRLRLVGHAGAEGGRAAGPPT